MMRQAVLIWVLVALGFLTDPAFHWARWAGELCAGAAIVMSILIVGGAVKRGRNHA